MIELPLWLVALILALGVTSFAAAITLAISLRVLQKALILHSGSIRIYKDIAQKHIEIARMLIDAVKTSKKDNFDIEAMMTLRTIEEMTQE